MKEDYLWDRTGEVDPEVQKLEEILGTLRYQPKPLRIPAGISIGRRSIWYPTMAIAATLALVALGLALWVNFSKRQTAITLEANNGPRSENKVLPNEPPSAPKDEVIVAGPTETPRRRREPGRFVPANYVRRDRNAGVSRPVQLTAQEQADKEQVLYALRLVSAKLNLAQRKTTGTPLNAIRNQHRIG